jgi:drug/metabolite transporter (DMT)-like permease
LLWVPVTLAGSFAQLFRNAAQAGLTARIGTLGATQTRFVFGLPFALVFLGVALAMTGAALPHFDAVALAWALAGALLQIVATALMLAVMGRRAFGVAYAYIKTEPVPVAIAGVLLLGDHLPPLAWAAAGIVSVGVLVASVPPAEWHRLLDEGRMIAAGVASGACFGLSSIAFRGALLALPPGRLLVHSLTLLALTLAIQTVLLGGWLAWRNRAALAGSIAEWRHSLVAGCAGATASACFMTAFALAPAANSRTLALVELPLAALVSGKLSGRRLAWHEGLGMVLVLGGVALLLTAQA